jgi:hypothetical protein
MAEMTPKQEVAWQMALAAMKRARRGFFKAGMARVYGASPEALERRARLQRAWLAEVNKAYDAAMAVRGAANGARTG